MLQHLHVKNLALIREAEIDFTEGLNILTGETGAGKSIIIGSIRRWWSWSSPQTVRRSWNGWTVWAYRQKTAS